ncbi:MAG: hypothetical protein AAGG44_21270, partial [Planctomycetota bacterium]
QEGICESGQEVIGDKDQGDKEVDQRHQKKSYDQQEQAGCKGDPGQEDDQEEVGETTVELLTASYISRCHSSVAFPP